MWILKYRKNYESKEETVGVFPSESWVATVARVIMVDDEYGGGSDDGVTMLIGSNGEQVVYYEL